MCPIGPARCWSPDPRCGAKTWQCTPCAGPAMPNGRCQRHGGKSTGPRTAEGLARLKQVPMKHGRRAAEIREAARERGAARREICVSRICYASLLQQAPLRTLARDPCRMAWPSVKARGQAAAAGFFTSTREHAHARMRAASGTLRRPKGDKPRPSLPPALAPRT